MKEFEQPSSKKSLYLVKIKSVAMNRRYFKYDNVRKNKQTREFEEIK